MKKPTMNKNAKRIYTALIDALAYALAYTMPRNAYRWDEAEVSNALKVCVAASGLPAPTYDQHDDEAGTLRRLIPSLAEAIASDDLDESVYEDLDSCSLFLLLFFQNNNEQPEGHFLSKALPVLLDIYAAGKTDQAQATAIAA